MLDAESPYPDVTFIDLPEITLAAVRCTQVTLDELRPLFHRAMRILGEAMSAGRFRPDGPFLAVYRGDVPIAFDVDIGFPAHGLDTAEGLVSAVRIPAGPAAVLSHFGSYDALRPSWTRVMEVAEAAGKTPTGDTIEVYVGDPAITPIAEVRTDLIALLR